MAYKRLFHEETEYQEGYAIGLELAKNGQGIDAVDLTLGDDTKVVGILDGLDGSTYCNICRMTMPPNHEHYI